ncbi:MAG: nuclear transport factor 2 family protein [Acidimicrobiales bacterium]
MEQIRRTLGQYGQWLDDGLFDEWAELFTDDARLIFGDQVTEGRRAIREYIMTVQAAGSRGLHVTTNSLIDVDGGSASATTDYVFVRPTPQGLGIIAAGRYHDRLVRDGGRWRFCERTITMLGSDREPG